MIDVKGKIIHYICDDYQVDFSKELLQWGFVLGVNFKHNKEK